MHCPFCGAELADSARFCGNCGQKQPLPEAASQTQVTETPQFQKQTSEPSQEAPEQTLPDTASENPEAQQFYQQQSDQQQFYQQQSDQQQPFGQPQFNPQPFGQPQFNPIPPKQPKKKKTGLVIFIVALILALILGGGIFAIYKLATTTDSDKKITEKAEKTPDKKNDPDKKKDSEKDDNDKTSKTPDALYNFELNLNGQELKFPMTYEELLALGWTTNEDLSATTLTSEEYSYGIDFEKNNFKASFIFFNPEASSLDLTKCQVGGIEFYMDDLEDAGGSVVIAENVQLKSATPDDIIKAFGKPTDRYDGDYYTSLEYSKDYYQYYEFSFSQDDNKLDSIELLNLISNEDAINNALDNVSQEKTERTKSYTQPEALGNIQDLTFELDGELHKLASVPIYALTEQGWTVDKSAPAAIASGSIESVSLTKNNHSIICGVKNPENEPVAIGNAIIDSVSVNNSGSYPSIKIFKDISIGTSQSDLETALSGIDNKYDKEEYESGIFYSITADDYSWSYDIVVDLDSKCISSIYITSYDY